MLQTRDVDTGVKIEMDLLIQEARPDDAEAIVDIFNPIIKAGIYTVFDAPFTVEA